MYQQNLSLNEVQRWICYKTQPTIKIMTVEFFSNYNTKSYELLRLWKPGVELTAGGKSLAKDPKKYIPRRWSITISISNNDDANQSHTQEMHSRIQT